MPTDRERAAHVAQVDSEQAKTTENNAFSYRLGLLAGDASWYLQAIALNWCVVPVLLVSIGFGSIASCTIGPTQLKVPGLRHNTDDAMTTRFRLRGTTRLGHWARHALAGTTGPYHTSRDKA